ncbi:hypothetical protein BS78_K138300 [Paspalum vaginatum]|uniref:Uncharacterized protein n=1 Tax=Paspalum vaginatum TaxID=158149 RepID=A0A9W8CE17_9POAL|nr:hypothetical protein BS78_K138300 [Paspalum vaginatum]
MAFASSYPLKELPPVARDLRPLVVVAGGDDDRKRGASCPAAESVGGFPWQPTAGLAYLTFSSGMALHRSWPDPGAVAFIVFAYVDLAALIYCLRRYERAEPGSTTRDRLKAVVWTLTAALTLLFSYKVAALMPPAVAALVWIMGMATVAGGFVAFFCFDKTV